MNWDRCVTIGAQLVVVVVLGVLVALGHDSAVTDGLLAVSGSVVGVGLAQTPVVATLAKGVGKVASTLKRER